MKRILSFLLALVLGLGPAFQPVFAQTIVPSVPGMVGDDTDVFLINPNISNDYPNVLIIWDTTANWGQTVDNSTAYALEKQALAQVVQELGDPTKPLAGKVNIGLMLFTETGKGNDNVSGTYPRFPFTPMDVQANRDALITLVNNLDQTDDRGSNAQYAKALYEAYLWFTGSQNFAGGGQVKRSLAAFGNSGNRNADYKSPVTDPCQKNYIIFIGNGPTDSGENNSAEAILIKPLDGKLASDPIELNPDAEEANWMDEYARFFSGVDLDPDDADNKQTVTIHTISVYDSSRETQRSTASVNALLNSAAKEGGGNYYAATNLQQIIDALNDTLDRIQADDSVFTSTSLPVSVNVRGTQLNQVYMGMFRPDDKMKPRWYGNLKMYKFGLDTNTDPPTPILVDKDGRAAADATNGFIDREAVSHWTDTSTFWSFRTSEENGFGGASDSPDGDKVEKGAVGQQLRIAYATTPDGRNLYTCTGSCTASSLLSLTPFKYPDNGDLTITDFGVADIPALTDLVLWVRGEDNGAVDENDNSTKDVRASIHGDVLHSRPALINYNRNNDDNDIIAFYGSNDGVFRAVQGGTLTGAGAELWGFIPPEVFGRFKRLRDNSQEIDISNKKPYFMDGPIGVYQKDVNNDGKLVAADGDKVYLYIGMRRGGRFIYALDVSDPTAPKLLWKKTQGTDTGFGELGYTWSEPKLGVVRAHTDNSGNPLPVLIMAAGYDPNQDNDPVTLDDGMGRGVMVLDAQTGEMLWQVGPSPSGASQGNLTEAGMKYSIPSDVTALDRNSDGFIDRVYVGDTGGNLWRVDMHSDVFADWSAVKLAVAAADANLPDTQGRKFMYPPDVVYSKDATGPYDAVLLGTGDREHPFNTSVVNRFYMFKDRTTGLVSSQNPAIDELDLFDATSNVIQTGSDSDKAAAKVDLASKLGWMIKLVDQTSGLPDGEKVISGSVTLSGITFFNTNTPAPANSPACKPTGEALQYAVAFDDATAPIDSSNAGIGLRAIVYAGGGYLPSPVPVVVNLGGRLYQAVISGPQVRAPEQLALETRYRTYWYIRHD